MLSLDSSRLVVTALSCVGFLLNLLAASVPTWGIACDTAPTGDEVCNRLGLFQWCVSEDGRNKCYGFDPSTIHKPQTNKNYYYAAQFFMLVCVAVGGLYVVLDVLTRVLSLTRESTVQLIAPPAEKRLFYACVGAEVLAGIIVMSIWAHQENTHEHNLTGFGKVYFKYGNAFSSCIFAWVLCFFAMAARFLLIDRFGDASQANFTPSGISDTPYTAAPSAESSPYHGPTYGGL